MDGSRFDGITRALATDQTRRWTLQGFAGSALAGLLGLIGSEDAAAACVKPGKKGCDGPNNKQCYRGTTCQGGSRTKEGTCKCTGKLKACGGTCVNTKKDDKHCGGCNKRCKGQNTCKNGRCTSKLGCKAGFTICNETKPIEDLDDPRICGGSGLSLICLCITDVSGVARCVDVGDSACSTCKRNADCGPGFVCVDGRGPACNCPEANGVGRGNACFRANCDGLSGSSAGRGRTVLKSALLR